MNTHDPIAKIEQIAKEAHTEAGKYTQPVLRRYPLMFAFLSAFSLAAILHGFGMVVDQVDIFKNHPSLLIALGAVTLFFTGTLYKSLEKMR
jgi:hypothetical protein